MKIVFLVIGKTDEKYLDEGIQKYIGRLQHYISFEMKTLPDLKNRKTLSFGQQKTKEGELLLAQLKAGDELILLDETGTAFTSRSFADWTKKKMVGGSNRLVFVVGGPYGFSNEMYTKATFKMSLSQLTFSHQMVRLIFVEQLYRAMTIIQGEPYHHD
jgi:23S rRNA (pseudouridine1915-N3)-methyltransferase